VEQFLENLHAMDSQISGVHKKLGHLFKSGGMHFLLERVACRTMANHGERSKLKHIKVSFYDGLPPQAHSGRDGPMKKRPINRRYVQRKISTLTAKKMKGGGIFSFESSLGISRPATHETQIVAAICRLAS
jgi:hypothetical protein